MFFPWFLQTKDAKAGCAMKKTNIMRTLSIALTLALLAVVVLAVPVLAQEYIEVTPSTNQIGERAYVYGYYFNTDRTVYIYLSNDQAYEGDQIDDEVDTYEAVRSAGTGATGTFDTYFTIPTEMNDGSDDENVGPGTYYVFITYTTSDTILVVDDFTIESTGEITLDPDEGVVDAEVEITGEGFDDREDIIVEYDGDEIDIEDGYDETDSSGDFECTIIIPESTAGDHTITVTGDDSDIEASADFTVEPEMTIDPEAGAVGSSVTVSGTGFGDRVEFFITFDGDDVDIASGDDETDRDGSFESTFVVPAVGAGSYDVEVEDDDDNLGTAEFTTAAIIASISANSGVAGTQVTVGGIGFRRSQPITVTFDNTSVATTSDASGNFNASFTVPDRGSGTYLVKVSDGSTTKEFNFEIMLSASITPATSAAAPGNVGTAITINGVGFTAGRTVNVTYDGNPVTTAVVTAAGTFIATFDAPASAGGPHTIIATDLTNTRQFTFYMEATPPSFPIPLKPEMGIKEEAQAYFDWEDVTDPSGVTYTLQIATTEDFSAGSIVLEIEDLTQSEYALSEIQALASASEEAPYYWHVRAIDGTGSGGLWSGAGSFYVAGSSVGSLSQGLIYTIIGVGGAILIILAFWLARKTSILRNHGAVEKLEKPTPQPQVRVEPELTMAIPRTPIPSARRDVFGDQKRVHKKKRERPYVDQNGVRRCNRLLKSGVICGNPVVEKEGRNGPFWSCANFKEHTK